MSPAAVAATATQAAARNDRQLMNWPARAFSALSAAIGTVAGITPHVLHHIGPIAGAAVLTGTGGSVLFGAIGFGLTVPLLLKLKKRFGTWLAPGVALTLFAIMFTISTLWIGPAIRGDGENEATPSDPHHATMVPDGIGVDVSLLTFPESANTWFQGGLDGGE